MYSIGLGINTTFLQDWKLTLIYIGLGASCNCSEEYLNNVFDIGPDGCAPCAVTSPSIIQVRAQYSHGDQESNFGKNPLDLA